MIASYSFYSSAYMSVIFIYSHPQPMIHLGTGKEVSFSRHTPNIIKYNRRVKNYPFIARRRLKYERSPILEHFLEHIIA